MDRKSFALLSIYQSSQNVLPLNQIAAIADFNVRTLTQIHKFFLLTHTSKIISTSDRKQKHD